jgi:hypothetical protein
MFPNVDCFIGVKDEFSIEEAPDTLRGLFSLVRPCTFKFGDEVLETMMVQYADKQIGFWVVQYLAIFTVVFEVFADC